MDRTGSKRGYEALIPPRAFFGLLTAVLLVGAMAPGVASAQGMVRIDVTIGKSQVIELKDAFTRVSVTNPNIADVFVVTPTQILLNGKAVGVTSLIVFYPARTMFFDVVVQTDLALLKERLKDVAPRDEIHVQAAQDAIVLSGTVSSQHLVGGAQDLAAAFAPRGRVINLLSFSPVKAPQVMLQVHVAEASREALRELGFSIRALGRTFQGAAFPGVPFAPAIGTLGAAIAGGSSSLPSGGFIEPTPDMSLNGASFFLSSGARDYAGVVRALAERNLLRTLAKPNLVTESGREAKFLSGGEFPFPVSQALGAISVEWREFGVGLIFTPVVLDGETISLRIRPEVSSLDFSQGVVAAGIAIPVIRKNEAFTNINLKDGETFAIAGLINNQVRQSVSKIPILGDIPIIGALFRSSRFQNEESELLFLVTVKQVRSLPPGSPGVPDPARLLEMRPEEKKEFTLIPGVPGVGEIVERPLGSGNLLAPVVPPGSPPGK
jgi:pilus assembly protein CpaC